MTLEVRVIRTLQDPEKIKKVGEFFQINTENSINFIWYWTEQTLFKWDFWLSWCFAIVPWILWLRYRNKQNNGRLLLAGFLAIIIASWLDFTGVNIGLWYYTGLAIPTIPDYVPWDFCMIPVLIMFMLQISPQTSAYLKALMFALISAFIGEPLFLWIGFYKMLHWNLLYSIPLYFLLFILCHKVSRIRFE
ncbi:CBO0543 family protein [Paenibacillus aestuarii]|uniref:CBO0543 family protein n=1 Tax=Paenibacillus aestuarii TaxID=516965 RepID=A0ABW0K9R2_9BACL|nr:CBO0543 family protein [Paenibacillus aestuarii]